MSRARWLLVAAVACAGCGSPRPAPVSSPERAPPAPAPSPAATTVRPAAIDAAVAGLAAAGAPCSPDAIADLFHPQAWPELLRAKASDRAAVDRRAPFAASLAGEHLCAWLERTVDYTALRRVDGDDVTYLVRAVEKGAFDYHEVRWRRDDRGAWRIVDVRSHLHARWLSDEVADRLQVDGGDAAAAVTVATARELLRDGRHHDALAQLATLPVDVDRRWTVQRLRLAIARGISDAAYFAAWNAYVALHPVRDRTALWKMDQAGRSNRPADALRHLDELERVTGGDPLLHAERAGLLVRRGEPGDLELAAASARRAVEALPGLAYPWWSKLLVARSQGDWTELLAANDRLRALGSGFDDEQLATKPWFAPLRASPAYAAWKIRPR
jgi:hypothetical protein